jgi:hypothetical protein
MTVQINSKMVAVNDSFSVNMYDNGYMIEYSGRDAEMHFVGSKTMCANLEELITLIQVISDMPKNT